MVIAKCETAMLALARTRLSRPGLSHCGVRLADMYRLPFGDANFDLVVLHMVLHHAEDTASVLAEAARVLRPGGRLVAVDLAPHEPAATLGLALRWPGFTDDRMIELMHAAGLAPQPALTVPGRLETRLWPALRIPDAAARSSLHAASLDTQA
jgi:ArsR family transcriptional regulator